MKAFLLAVSKGDRSVAQRLPARAGFVELVLGLIDTFYEQIVQSITPWLCPAPKAKKPIATEPDEEAGEAIRQAPPPVLVDGE